MSDCITLRTKKPTDRLDYDVDFGKHWLTNGDAIDTVDSVTVDTTGTVAQDGYTHIGTAVKVWLKDGTDGETATVTVTVTTNDGREKTICFKVRVKDEC